MKPIELHNYSQCETDNAAGVCVSGNYNMSYIYISSHIMLNIQFENCHSLTDVQWLMYVGW